MAFPIWESQQLVSEPTFLCPNSTAMLHHFYCHSPRSLATASIPEVYIHGLPIPYDVQTSSREQQIPSDLYAHRGFINPHATDVEGSGFHAGRANNASINPVDAYAHGELSSYIPGHNYEFTTNTIVGGQLIDIIPQRENLYSTTTNSITGQSLKRLRFRDHHVFAPANLFSHAIWDTVKLRLLLEPSPSIGELGISLTDGDQHTLKESFDGIKKVFVGRQIIEDNAESLNEKMSYFWCKLKEVVGKTDGQDDQKVVGIAIKVTDLYCRNISFISTSSSYLKDDNGVATLLIYSPQKKINETMMVFDLRYDTYSELFHQFNDGDFAWLSTFYVIYIDCDEFEMVLESLAILIIFQDGHVRMCVIEKENSYGVVVSSILLNCDGAVLKLKRVGKLASLFKFSRIIQNGLNGAASLLCQFAKLQWSNNNTIVQGVFVMIQSARQP
ncbi:uncharacterized protein LOC132042775 [Lycium ferocissimum]|uniref:uncharacterized protein LOC132042775 n=1 Tax=Lycium ferocissimum TaxID=112874 RepID=UPI002815D33C|nr:uncharacterized protein LOC132042775 [Lycium ferocissimum]